MAVSLAHCQLMEEVGKLADEQWEKNGRLVAGAAGFVAVQYQSITLAHPSFPIFMTALCAMPALSNGATTAIWGKPDPLALCVLNVNHSQTRKSRLGGLVESMLGVADEKTAQWLSLVYDLKAKCAQEAAQETQARTARKKRLGVAMAGATATQVAAASDAVGGAASLTDTAPPAVVAADGDTGDAASVRPFTWDSWRAPPPCLQPMALAEPAGCGGEELGDDTERGAAGPGASQGSGRMPSKEVRSRG